MLNLLLALTGGATAWLLSAWLSDDIPGMFFALFIAVFLIPLLFMGWLAAIVAVVWSSTLLARRKRRRDSEETWMLIVADGLAIWASFYLSYHMFWADTPLYQ